MPTLSVCMIVRNEAKHLERCLNSIKHLADEIVIIDTGSVDDTKKIASRFTDKVFDFEWCDDFSAVRNKSLKHATSDWILVLDADEVMPDESVKLIKNAMEGVFDAYFLPQVTYTNKYKDNPTFVLKKANFFGNDFAGYFYGYIIRLFRNSSKIKYDLFVHEIVDLSVKKNDFKVGDLMVPIIHLHELKGLTYLDEKQKIYFKLLLKNIEKYPRYAKSYNDVALYYNTYQQDSIKSLEFSKIAVKLDSENIEFILNLGYRLRSLKRYEEALKVFFNAFNIGSHDERVLVALGFIFYKLNRYKESVDFYEKVLLLNSPKKEHIIRVIGNVKKEAISKGITF